MGVWTSSRRGIARCKFEILTHLSEIVHIKKYGTSMLVLIRIIFTAPAAGTSKVTSSFVSPQDERLHSPSPALPLSLHNELDGIVRQLPVQHLEMSR